MIQSCKHNPICDVERVAPSGALDLAKAYALGSIPSTLEGSEADYNGIDEPASIVGKPDDVFSAMQAGKVIEEAGKKSDDDK